MKCLFTIRSLTGGGAERVVSVLANAMVEQGYDTYIAVYARTEKDYALDDRVHVITMPARKDSAVTKLMRIADMRRIITEIKPDVIIPFVGTVLYVTWFASLGMGSKFILTVRNNPWKVPLSGKERKIRDYLAQKADVVMIQNEEQADYFPETLKHKMVVVNNPVSKAFLDTRKEVYADTICKIVSVGRLNPQKNQTLLIHAFAQVLQKHSRIALYIYGEGPEKEKLKTLIDALGLQDKCFLMGRSLDMTAVLCDADLFVMTSDFEGMPNALMEAMAVGVPCISSDCMTGPKSLIKNGETGILFKTGDQSELVCVLDWAVTHAQEMKQMGMQARNYMLENYTPEKTAAAVEYLLRGGEEG